MLQENIMKDQLNEKLLHLLDLKPTQNCDILDFGCGSGELLGTIHDILPESSKLIGIDSSEKSIKEAKNNYPFIDFHHEKFVDAFNFPDASFDIVISVDTIECVPNKPALISEINRMLKKDGKVLAVHWDWDTQVYYSEQKVIIRKFVTEFSDWQQDWMESSDGQMGRKLWGLFQGCGLFKGNIETYSLLETEYKQGKYGYDRLHDLAGLVNQGKLDISEYKMILDEMKTLHETDKYFYSLNSYIYIGRKA
jgi:ubiquinone/menaquinone biosynthesis C-methylase UbiE